MVNMTPKEEKEKGELMEKYPGTFVCTKLTNKYHTKGRQRERRYKTERDYIEWGQFVRDGICFICGEIGARTFVDHHVFGKDFVFEGKRDRNNEIVIITESLIITLCANCHGKNCGWGGYRNKVKIHQFSLFWKGEIEEESATKYTHYWSILKGIESGFMFKNHSKHEKHELKIRVKPKRKHLIDGVCFICGELDYRKFVKHHVLGWIIKGKTITLCANCHKKNNGWYDKELFDLNLEGFEIGEGIPKKTFSDELWIYPREYWSENIRKKYEEIYQKKRDHVRNDKMEIILYLHGKRVIIEKTGYEYRHLKNVLKEIEKGVMFS